MFYLLDTNACVDILRRKTASLTRRVRRLDPNIVAMSSITLGELWYGAAKSSRPAHHESLISSICAIIQVLDLDASAAQIYGSLRAELEMQGRVISSEDLFIAAHALSLGATLITDNVREFKRVPGLQVQNWRR